MALYTNVWALKRHFSKTTNTPGALWNHEVSLDKTAENFGAHREYVDRVEDIAPAIERALASGNAALIHVVVDPEVTGSFDQIPGREEFRTWYGEEGDNLGFAGDAPATAAENSTDLPISKGSGN